MAKKRKTTKAKPKAKKGKRSTKLTQMNYSVSSELEEIIGAKKATRPQIVKKLWVYIKAKRLQDNKNRRLICPDAKLSKVLGSRPIDMMKMSGVLNKHIKK